MIRAAPGVTNPDAGGIATRPATAPHAAPTALNFLWWMYWASTQVTVAAAAAVLVATNVVDARPLAMSADPALKPNQPNHRRPAPRRVIGTSCGSIFSSPIRRLPMTNATTRAETPDEMWTTVPPAKSRAPIWNSQPPV